MTKRKLRGFVLPTIYTIAITGIFLSAILIANSLKTVLSDTAEYQYVTSAIVTNIQPVARIENDKIIKPFSNDKVAISKHYYNKDDDASKQQKALIYYENTYMQNSGVLYTSDEEFEIVAVLDGIIKNIKEDEILGTIVEIEHNEKLTTIYQSLSKANVKIGDTVKQGTVIGISGANLLENEKDNCLLFEVYKNGMLINPEEFYNLKIEALTE